MSATERQAQIDAYDDAIAYEDESLGRLLDELTARGGLENTVVIVTSDHGQEFGEHGRFGHGASMAWTLLGVPLVISFPADVPSRLRIDAPVSLRDLPATVADLTSTAHESPFPGVTLSRFWHAAGDMRVGAAALSEQKDRPEPMRSAVLNDLHYIRLSTGKEELYDLASDPAEMKDLLRGPGAIDRAGDLQALRCAARIGCTAAPQ
jgi:arylsulfatase A-like enzyme